MEMEDASSSKRKQSMTSNTSTNGVSNRRQRQSESGYRTKRPHLYWFAGVPTDYELPSPKSTTTKQSVETQELQTNGNAGVKDEHDNDGTNDEGSVKIVTARALLDGFSNFTSSHGISHIYFSAGIVKKGAWLLLSLAGTIFLCIHLGFLSMSYMNFTTSTNIDIVESRRLRFPAVTICNNNAIKASKLAVLTDERLKHIIGERWNGTLDGSDTDISSLKTYRQLSEVISMMGPSEKFKLGYDKNEMIVSCSFDGDNCIESDFWRFYDSNFGNCYTFNSGNVPSATTRKSTQAGPKHGLSLVINIGSYDYLPDLTEEAGVQVVLHSRSVMPFPEYSCIGAAPGHVNNIAMTKTKIERLAGKYGNCTHMRMNDENMYAIPFNVSYSQWACLRTCYQKELVKQCRCFDPNLPYNKSSVVFSKLRGVDGPCEISISEENECAIKIAEKFANRSLRCKHCTQACGEELYQGSLSTSTFPAMSYIGNFLKKLRMQNSGTIKTLKDNYGNGTISDEVLRTNFLKLNIFYQTMGYTLYEQVPSYEGFQFLSDLGGTFGLWVGWSALTFFEFVGFAADLMAYWCYKTGRC